MHLEWRKLEQTRFCLKSEGRLASAWKQIGKAFQREMMVIRALWIPKSRAPALELALRLAGRQSSVSRAERSPVGARKFQQFALWWPPYLEELPTVLAWPQEQLKRSTGCAQDVTRRLEGYSSPEEAMEANSWSRLRLSGPRAKPPRENACERLQSFLE